MASMSISACIFELSYWWSLMIGFLFIEKIDATSTYIYGEVLMKLSTISGNKRKWNIVGEGKLIETNGACNYNQAKFDWYLNHCAIYGGKWRWCVHGIGNQYSCSNLLCNLICNSNWKFNLYLQFKKSIQLHYNLKNQLEIRNWG